MEWTLLIQCVWGLLRLEASSCQHKFTYSVVEASVIHAEKNEKLSWKYSYREYKEGDKQREMHELGGNIQRT